MRSAKGTQRALPVRPYGIWVSARFQQKINDRPIVTIYQQGNHERRMATPILEIDHCSVVDKSTYDFKTTRVDRQFEWSSTGSGIQLVGICTSAQEGGNDSITRGSDQKGHLRVV